MPVYSWMLSSNPRINFPSSSVSFQIPRKFFPLPLLTKTITVETTGTRVSGFKHPCDPWGLTSFFLPDDIHLALTRRLSNPWRPPWGHFGLRPWHTFPPPSTLSPFSSPAGCWLPSHPAIAMVSVTIESYVVPSQLQDSFVVMKAPVNNRFPLSVLLGKPRIAPLHICRLFQDPLLRRPLTHDRRWYLFIFTTMISLLQTMQFHASIVDLENHRSCWNTVISIQVNAAKLIESLTHGYLTAPSWEGW